MGEIDGFKGGALTHRSNGILYPTMLIAAMAVIIFSVIGIAAMTGLLPSALPRSADSPEPAAAPAAPKAPARAEKAPAAAPAAAPGPGGRGCADCGVVSSIRTVEAAPAPTGLGAVAGGVVGGVLGNQVGGGRGRTAMTVVGAGAGAYAGHEIEKRMDRRVAYEVRVRMEDGSYRTFVQPSEPGFAVGQKVRVGENGIVGG